MMIILLILSAIFACFCLFLIVFMIDLLVFASKINRISPLFESDTEEFIKKIQAEYDRTHRRVKRNLLLLQLCLGYEKTGKADKALQMIRFVDEKALFLDLPLYYSCLCRFLLKCGERESAAEIFAAHRKEIEKMGNDEVSYLEKQLEITEKF